MAELNLASNAPAIAIVTGIIVVCFGALFWALRALLNSGVADMKAAVKAEIENFNSHCKLVSGNLHSAMTAETKQRVRADEKIEIDFKNHGHKGLDNGGSKVTI